MNPGIIIFLLISIILFFPVSIPAETIYLKSGKKIEGKILEKTDQYIKVDYNGSPLYYELKYITRILEDEPSVSLPAKTAATVDYKLNFERGLKYATQAKFKEAEEEFKQGLAQNPSEQNLMEVLSIIEDLKSGAIKREYALYVFRGSDYLLNKQYQQAITEFEGALKLKPDNADLYYYLGVCNHELKQYEQALAYLNKSLEMKPNEELYYYLGATHYSMGQLPEALTYLKKSIEMSPEDAEAYSLIGTSYYFLGQIRLARENLNKARELFQNKGDFLNASDIDNFLKKLK